MNIEQLRELALSFPKVTEDIKWENDLCFCIGEKMFCITGADEFKGVTLKVNDDEFDELCARQGIVSAPYMGRYKWISAMPDAFSNKEWQHYVKQSYEIVKAKLPKKTRIALNLV